jgi:hypothetical protein
MARKSKRRRPYERRRSQTPSDYTREAPDSAAHLMHCVGLVLIMSEVVVAIAYLAEAFLRADVVLVHALPDILGAQAAVVATATLVRPALLRVRGEGDTVIRADSGDDQATCCARLLHRNAPTAIDTAAPLDRKVRRGVRRPKRAVVPQFGNPADGAALSSARFRPFDGLR